MKNYLHRSLRVGLIVAFVGMVFFAFPQFSVAAKVTEIVYWQHMYEPRARAMREIYQDFQKENPDIKVDLNFIPWGAYFDKLFVSIAAGTGPDIFQISMGLAEQFIQGGNIISLDIPIEEVKRDFLPWTIERLIAKDKIWGLPTDVQSTVLFINNSLLREAGLDPGKPPTSWDEVIEYAKKLTKREVDGTIIQAGMQTMSQSYALEASFFQAGVPPMYNEAETKALFDGSNPEALRALTYLTDFTTKYGAEDPQFNSPENFPLGKVGMVIGVPVIGGSFEERNPDLDFTLIMLPPVHSTDKPLSAGSHWEYFITKKAPREAAIKFVKALTSEKAQKIFVQVAGDTVSRKALLNSPELRKDPNRATALDSLQYCEPISWIGWAIPHKLYSDAVERAVYGKATPKESLDILAQEITKSLTE